MGTYVPRGSSRPKTISEALAEAEHDHFLDCPDADFYIRTGAILLDGILFWLLWSGIHHTFTSVGPSLLATAERLSLFHQIFPPSDGPLRPEQILPFMEHVAHGLLFFLYFCATLSAFGGSPGKLLLGLRVVDSKSGAKLSFGRAIFRELFGKILSTLPLAIGWGMAFVREDTRALHDLAAGTVVKRTLTVAEGNK